MMMSSSGMKVHPSLDEDKASLRSCNPQKYIDKHLFLDFGIRYLMCRSRYLNRSLMPMTSNLYLFKYKRPYYMYGDFNSSYYSRM